MQHIIEILNKWAEGPSLGIALKIAVLLLLVLPLVYMVARLAQKTVARKYSQQAAMLVSKGIGYLGFILVLVAVLNELDFKLGAFLGTAGVLAMAIGFASQTSLSNIISGLFLISEKPFEVGDLIRVGDDVGMVLSIDLLSVKIRAMDNRYIRIPNENLIKLQLVNLTRFPIRRIDINVGVAYKEDPKRIIEVLKNVARLERLCLDDPEPMVLFQAFGDSALEFLFGVWCLRSDYLTVRNNIMSAVKTRFDEEGIEMPFPHRSLYTGSLTQPMPIRIVRDEPDKSEVAEDGGIK